MEETDEEFLDELKKAGLSIGKYEIKFGEIYCVAGKVGGREVEGRRLKVEGGREKRMK
jgi:hypothetical protein